MFASSPRTLALPRSAPPARRRRPTSCSATPPAEGSSGVVKQSLADLTAIAEKAASKPKGFGKPAAAPAQPAKGSECPCGTGLAYATCCGLFHAQPGSEPSPEAVLRARFSAYVLGSEAGLDYLVATTHPRSRDFVLRGVEGNVEAPSAEALAAAAAQLRLDAGNTSRNIAFKKLSITKSEKGGNELEAWVTYRATYIDRTADKPRFKQARWRDVDQTSSLAERSRFLQSSDGSWRYFGATPLTGSKGLGSYDAAPPPPTAP